MNLSARIYTYCAGVVVVIAVYRLWLALPERACIAPIPYALLIGWTSAWSSGCKENVY
jgi:hypothetical protein